MLATGRLVGHGVRDDDLRLADGGLGVVRLHETPFRTMMRLSGSVRFRCALSVGSPERVART
jgi:hypothetical protein